MDWSVEEQTIPCSVPLTITAINLRVDPSDSSQVMMELQGEPDADPPGYVLRFHRNGKLISAQRLAPPAPPAETPPEGSEPTAHAAGHRTRTR